MRVLVTGASGFIGGKLCERLELMDVPFRCCGRRPMTRPEYFQWDLSKPLKLLNESFDVVIHAAARSSPWGSYAAFHSDNVIGTENIVDFCHSIGCPKLVFISSSSVYYQNCHQLNISEQTAQAAKPVNRYARTKQQAEQLVRAYRGDWAILRPRAVFGPGDTVLLPRILEAARQGRLPLITPKGPPTVGDLIYIDNLVDYIVAAAFDAAVVGEFNLTNNEPVEINSFLLQIFNKLGIALPRRSLSVGTAMLGATFLELFHRVLLPWKEPAITRFGVHVFAYSKTFDVSKSIEFMGPPRISIEEGVQRVVDEQLTMASKRAQ